MAGQVGASPSTDSFEYELFEDADHLKTVVSTPNRINLWIDPEELKLKHRIGRGPFGDVWIATHHRSTEDYDEYHEIAIKMLYPIKEGQVDTFLAKFEDAFSKCQELQGVCFLHGISIKNGKICIAMKFYEGSVGDKMAHLKGGKIPLADVIRYGIDLAHAITELHTRGILILNLKPFNFLLDDHDQAVLGDFGIPSLFLGIALPNPDLAVRLGTPSYMAPEQWEPDIRGPISFETDSWGFGCSLVEMLSGFRPWSGRSAEEIRDLVLIKQEKPNIPSGLPPAIENVFIGCFEYDFRNRPLMTDILQTLKSCQNASYDNGGWRDLGSRVLAKSSNTGYSEWFLSKVQLQMNDIVRSRKPTNSCKMETMYIPEGTVVGFDSNGYVLVRVHGIHNPLRVHSSILERVSLGFAIGDWVRVKTDERRHSPVGILHSVERDGRVTAAFIGMETLWTGSCSDLQMAESYCVGQFVRLKENVFNPRFDWPCKRGGAWATGRIWQILPNGCLVVKFPGRLVFGDAESFLADPDEVETVSFGTCPGLVKKYQHLEDFHWAVRPLVIAVGLFTALKLGFFMGKNVGRSRLRCRRRKGGNSSMEGDGEQDGQNVNNPARLPSFVANMLFREGVPTTR